MSSEQFYAGLQERTYQDANLLQFRLETEPLIREFELFLSGKRGALQYNKEQGKYLEVEIQYGKPLANPQGINSILKLIISSVNPQNVQGNFKEDHYNDYICWRRKEITDAIVINRAKWGIHEDDMNMIIDNIMALIEPFMTRLIDNLERESLGKNFGVKEVHTIDSAKQSLLPSLKR
ncbi:MAG: hypothetical protein QW165_04585 [Candidatus Woesearchaeota archaeon]